ncbi:hypothetical protein [Mycolicibacterium iranicum]|uniref:Cellulose synthase n=1 Tax=Mycolicibacterium iranicum TaxID=912594 RepID=A0A178M3C3_MYCIR|nr:hypothetical protein [Mycolicibacterium iranicum]OAN42375.1 hypothetical protein A4X20_01355 [Mycolicibacterium iranicum]
MSRTSVVRVLVSVMVLFAPSVFGAAAHAQPGDGGPAPEVASVTLGWADLGMERELFLSPNDSQSFSVPVPAGLNATRLRGTINTPLNIDAGYVEIDDADGRLLATVDVLPAGPARAETPFDVDIAGARVRDSSVELSFTVRALGNPGQFSSQYEGQFCGPLQQLTVTNLATVFTGVEPPVTTIAGFFPPVLERVTIYAPDDSDVAEQQSVLLLVATLARIYNPLPLDVSVVNQPRGASPPPAGPLARAVVVERGGEAGLRVENAGEQAAYLRVSGDGDTLSTQVSLLVDELQSLVQVPSARVDEAGSGEVPSSDTFTFAQLNLSGRTEVLRSSNLRVGVGRSQLGNGRVGSVQVNLLADYTPVPDRDSAAVVIRSADGNVVYRSLLDTTGRLDARFDIPGQTMGQFVNLDIALTYTPQQVCGPLIAPMSFQIDPKSSLTITRGGPPLGGFSALPSEFSPSFLVAFDGSSPDQLVYAGRVVAAIASLTNRQLTPKVVDVKTAGDANSGALIIAKSSALEQTSLLPPISGDGGEVSVDNLPAELSANIGDGLGSIQVFADRPRDRTVVLVTTTDAWSLVDPLFTYIDGLEGKWSALSGDVLAAGRAGVATNLSVFAQPTGEDVAEAPPAETSPPWAVIGIAVAVAAAGAILAGILWSSLRRKRRQSVPAGDAQSTPAT